MRAGAIAERLSASCIIRSPMSWIARKRAAFTKYMVGVVIAPRVPLPDGGRAGTGGRDFVFAHSSKSARVK